MSTHSPLGLTDSLDHKRRSRKEIRGNLLCETPAHSPLGMTQTVTTTCAFHVRNQRERSMCNSYPLTFRTNTDYPNHPRCSMQAQVSGRDSGGPAALHFRNKQTIQRTFFSPHSLSAGSLTPSPSPAPPQRHQHPPGNSLAVQNLRPVSENP